MRLIDMSDANGEALLRAAEQAKRNGDLFRVVGLGGICLPVEIWAQMSGKAARSYFIFDTSEHCVGYMEWGTAYGEYTSLTSHFSEDTIVIHPHSFVSVSHRRKGLMTVLYEYALRTGGVFVATEQTNSASQLWSKLRDANQDSVVLLHYDYNRDKILDFPQHLHGADTWKIMVNVKTTKILN